MLINTHLLMSHILYNHISKAQNIKINRLAFSYGCIKPDIDNNDIKKEHTLDNSIESLEKYSKKLLSNSMSIKDFSMSLGVMCHFICDYFCLYHNDEYSKKSILQHFLYEMKLHFKLLLLILSGKLTFYKYNPLGKDLIPMILEQQQKYTLEEKSLTKDIKYALTSATVASKFMLTSSKIVLNDSTPLISEIYNL